MNCLKHNYHHGLCVFTLSKEWSTRLTPTSIKGDGLCTRQFCTSSPCDSFDLVMTANVRLQRWGLTAGDAVGGAAVWRQALNVALNMQVLLLLPDFGSTAASPAAAAAESSVTRAVGVRSLINLVYKLVLVLHAWEVQQGCRAKKTEFDL